MGHRQIRGIEWTCDHCGKTEMAPDQKDVDETMLAPKGWFTGRVRQSSGERDGQSRDVEEFVACTSGHIKGAIDSLLAQQDQPIEPSGAEG